MSQPQPSVSRTGFYPASARDTLEPLQLFKGWIDHLIFCDLHKIPQAGKELQELRAAISKDNLPEASFFLGDVLTALVCIKPVDVFLVRNDSCGEGGSGLALLQAERIRCVLDAIKPGGLLVTDRPSGYLWLTRMLSGKSTKYQVGDRVLWLSDTQPWSAHGLYAVNVD